MSEEDVLLFQELGRQIRESRERQHLTREALAEKMGIDPSHVWKLEKGKVNMKLTTFLKLYTLLSLPVPHRSI
ncbi:helix-turn-helix domain-containing protein [Mailhella sp.]|uniref:helix-turn-helix domain-containing protein n=1 Tax=Mailhella sp. TaxID=1981029 RepID=UPI004064728A